MNRGNSVADALGSQQFDGFANLIRPANLACVHQPVQTHLRGAVVDGAEFLCRNAQLVAANAEGHDGFRIAALSGFDDFHRRVHAKLSSGIKYPVESEPAAFEWLGGSKEGFKIRFRALLPKEHHADGKGYFRIDHTLREQMFGKVAGDERVVLRLAQERGNPFEGFDEFGEVAVGVAPADFLFGHDDTVTGRQRADGRGLDGSFEMEVQLGLGQGSNPVGE